MKRKTKTLSDLFSDDFLTIDGLMSFFRYKTVRELSQESGIDSKRVSRVVKEMRNLGYVLKKGRSYKYPNG